VGVDSWSGKVESRTSSLSMRGQWRTEAKEWANVDLPVPGWPFIAMISGPTALASSIVIVVIFPWVMQRIESLGWIGVNGSKIGELDLGFCLLSKG